MMMFDFRESEKEFFENNELVDSGALTLQEMFLINSVI